MTDTRSKDRLRDLVSALAAGELDQAEAQRVRARLAKDPELAALYGEIRAVRRGLADYAGGRAAPPAGQRGPQQAPPPPYFRTRKIRGAPKKPTR
ncbi:MAG: hypothetical protein OXP70_04005, partial [Acidobacteriota bacterium]|nr:hypothetical protein [Acidobacteriota bacterium]